jgi:hypothetical protein
MSAAEFRRRDLVMVIDPVSDLHEKTGPVRSKFRNVDRYVVEIDGMPVEVLGADLVRVDR